MNKIMKFDPAFAYVTILFFIWGFVTTTIDPLVPSVRSVFSLSYAESMLTQFSFFIAYGVVSLPAGVILAKLGFSRSIIIALMAIVAGCLLMPLATSSGAYVMVLAALFVIASGITLLQVAANPLAALLGQPEGSHFRLTLSQAVNSFGTMLAPIVASYLILRGGVFADAKALTNVAAREITLRHVDIQFLMIAVLIALFTAFLWRVRRHLDVADSFLYGTSGSPLRAFASGWAMFGAAAIFLYVGSEVAIGSAMINFLHQPSIFDVSYERAGQLLGLYWGGAMVGRALGSIVLLKIRAEQVLAVAAVTAFLLCFLITQVDGLLPSVLRVLQKASYTLAPGIVAGWAALAIGLFNSVMFPTIFTLTLERSTAPTSATSGLLCMAIVGGAILPVMTGVVADHVGLASAFVVPLCGYACVALFALQKPLTRPVLDLPPVKSPIAEP